jgi:two-component system, OmpR family, phosphate regulon response regulator OmpR
MKITKNSQHLLVVDDDARIRSLLQKYLVEQGYFVSTAKNTSEAETLLQEIECHLIILDLMMPEETGIEFTKRLRNNHKNSIPIIMLTAMGEFDDRINGLEVGADDYLVKPFEPKELLLRVYNLLKRSQNNLEKFYFGDFNYNINSKSLMQGNTSIFLTQSEHSLLDFLLPHANQIVTRDTIAKELNINERSVDVQIVRLRGKIESNPKRPQFLQTVRNQGYILRI